MLTALVTGGRTGLGHALAKELARRGWRTFAFSRRLEERRDSGVHWLRGDVTDVESIEEIRRMIARETSALDVLINNAGVGSHGFELRAVDPDEVTAQFLVHCVGALRVSQIFSNLLAAASRPVVVNITSRFGATSQIAAGNLDASGISYGYRIAKAAQNMLTQCLAHDPSLSRISVVAVNPGRLLTDSASCDANRRPEEAAKAILDILERRKFQSGMMIHAFGEECSW